MTQQTPSRGFNDLGIAPEFLKILERNNFTVPTPIQHQAIKPAMEGKDIVGIAQTGTGKTLAFGLPLLQRLRGSQGIGLILLPTRELALQADEMLQKIGRSLGLVTAVLIGGEPMGRQLMALRHRPNIIIATPGRLVDHIENNNLKLDSVRIIVLDEADRMLDIGFEPQIRKIFRFVPAQRQTLLFSATMPAEIVKIAAEYMTSPVRVEVAPSGTPAELVDQEIFLVKKEERISLLAKILDENKGTVLLFARTRHGARKICAVIRSMGHKVAEIHSDRSLGQRKEALAGFKSGLYRILVATDIAARGIDVKNIQLVINYDLPDNTQDYVHRIGRTGRAGEEGRAISFAMPDQRRDVRDIERLIRKEIPVTSHGDQAISFDAPAVRNFGRNRHLRREPRRWRRM
ncbi:MAG: DEAD/DEAH box helicase [Candidatus Taylorbacteria bacterium]|nr:DEAD/DEAH box helicase [Candidatus Taylorbacteria bacterium]